MAGVGGRRVSIVFPLWLCYSLLPWLTVPFKQPVHVSRNELPPSLSSLPPFLPPLLTRLFLQISLKKKKPDHTVLAH